MSDTATLLWEVGCEELPAWACDALQTQLPKIVTDELTTARLAVESDAQPVVNVGPRRFSVLVPARRERPALNERVSGPPVKIAFEGGDPAGAPTGAAQGFARKCGVDVADLVVDDAAGVLVAERSVPAAPIAELWPQLADRILGRIQFAKPMRWGSSAWRFVRPIRWMVTKHGDETLRYECWGVTSGDETRTHRFLGSARTATVPTADEYAATLAAAHVRVDQHERRRDIESGLDAAAQALGGTWSDPGGVLSEVVHLVESPTVITGRFDDSYLELPERVLVTAMQSHQRYLPVTRGDGLAPGFLAVMNADPAALDSILPGYERVIAGRLDDAVFSFERDRARGLDDMATDESLGAVVFHAQAGSLADRRDRITHVARELARQLDVDDQAVRDAARLAKADQVSGVVQEFAELEGFAGSLYASANGYNDDVCRAIDQQFLPRGLDSALPDAGVPAVVAMADKLELLVTMFAIGEQPTGSRDPHGLRRAAIGVTRIVLEHDLPVDIQAALAAAGAAVDGQDIDADVTGELLDQVHEFLLDRVEKRLADDGVRVDAVRAARAAELPQLQHLDELARAIDTEVRGGNPAFEHVLEAQDRSRRLLDKAGGSDGEPIRTEDLEADSERQLVERLDRVQEPLASAVRERRFGDAVQLAAELGDVVDAFFSKEQGVMIMADDDAVRANRLRILQRVVDVTAPLGDLSKLQV